jgi:hypothetical protein
MPNLINKMLYVFYNLENPQHIKPHHGIDRLHLRKATIRSKCAEASQTENFIVAVTFSANHHVIVLQCLSFRNTKRKG